MKTKGEVEGEPVGETVQGLGCFEADLVQIDQCSSLFDLVATHVQDERQELLRHGTVFRARQQTAGRGRQGRRWFSQEGKSLLMLLVLERKRLGLDIQNHTSILTLQIALSVARALETLRPSCVGKSKKETTIHIKWPNDVLLSEKKIAGILIEKKKHYYLVGIGLNVQALPWQEHEAQFKLLASSLQEEGIQIDVESVYFLLRESLKKHLKISAQECIAQTNTLLWKKNQQVHFQYAAKTIQGKLLKIGDTGGLLLEQDGKEQLFMSGELLV